MRGFTLIETLVALTVLTMIIIGPLSLATKSIGASIFSQNQITASYLAQEAIEYILNIRDNNFLQNLNWLTGLDQCLGADGCYVDIPSSNNNIVSCNNACPKIKYDGSGGYYYNYQTGQDTIFTRTIKITKITDDEARIDVTVSWQEKFGGQKSFTLQRNIFNWK
ncbi:MAG: prepilin-type N-terminal cleavage/methylation domain-containing protein [Candidatus Parcubacteria bacterium]|nr:prepilin-type N-terminal cleavage/methylation domain-containing protein [Candidatus Parcubacteria bacterium]